MHRLSSLKHRVDEWEELSHDVKSLLGMIELAREEPDPETDEEIAAWALRLQRNVDDLDFQTLLGGWA
jgi:hypothetical protein